MKLSKGFAHIFAAVAVTLVMIAGAVAFKSYQKVGLSTPLPQVLVQTSPSPTPSLIPTIKPTAAPTKKPTTTPTPTTAANLGCSKYKPEDGLATLTINLKEKDGKPLVGDWTVKIKPKSPCPGMLPPLWGSEINEVVRQPTYTYTSQGMHPGLFRVDVNYHYTGEGFDWEGTSGNHTKEITVSN